MSLSRPAPEGHRRRYPKATPFPRCRLSLDFPTQWSLRVSVTRCAMLAKLYVAASLLILDQLKVLTFRCAAFRLRRSAMPRPSRPLAKIAMLAGSGTDDTSLLLSSIWKGPSTFG